MGGALLTTRGSIDVRSINVIYSPKQAEVQQTVGIAFRRLAVSRRAYAWDEENQAWLRATLGSWEQRNIDVSHRPGERFPGVGNA